MLVDFDLDSDAAAVVELLGVDSDAASLVDFS